MLSTIVLAQLVALAAAPSLAAAPQHENPVFTQLVDNGVEFFGDELVPLPEPTLRDGLSEEAQKTALESVADARHPLDQLMRPSIVSPFVLEIRKDTSLDSDRPVRRIDVWFVAYGNIESLADEEFLRDLARQSEDRTNSKLPTEVVFLENADLEQRSLTRVEEETSREVWFHSKFSLFDRVQLHATRHAYVTRTPESILVASVLDERFTEDPDYPTAWNTVSRDRLGKFVLGDKQPYQSAGFYLKATQLHDPPDAIFVEYHQVFDEPGEWFDGANLLRSKLPLMVQDGVRKFRRKLDRATPQ